MRTVFVTVFYFVAALWMLVAAAGRVIIMVTTGARIDALPFVSTLLAIAMLVGYFVLPRGKTPTE